MSIKPVPGRRLPDAINKVKKAYLTIEKTKIGCCNFQDLLYYIYKV